MIGATDPSGLSNRIAITTKKTKNMGFVDV